MRKAGIMTLHIGDNYGALLQCYALRHTINSFEDIKAEVINYDPGRIFPSYDDCEVQELYEKKLERFQEFNRVCNGVAEPVLYDIYKNTPQYDYYITGSDQVWNTSFVFAKETYFLDFVPKGAKRISYAASIGLPVTSPKIKKEWFERNIPKFDWISLRESSHIPFVSQYTDKDVCAVVDPTMLLRETDYCELCEGTEYPEGEYILLYFLKHDDSAPLLINYANMLSRKYNLKVVYSFAKVPPCVFKNESETFYYSGPKEFVQAVRHAKFVVTNSFHGTIFSLLFHVPFYTYLVSSMASRVTDLLEETGLKDRIIHGYRKLDVDAFDIDFEKADRVLEEKRQRSLVFLKKALDVR